MMSSSRSFVPRAKIALPAFFCAVASACSDSTTSPPQPPITTNGQTVAVAYCSALAPTWVAFQDGDGAWTRALPEVRGNITTFRQELSSNRGAVATARPIIEGVFTALEVMYGAPSELPEIGDTSRVDCAAKTKTLTGSVVGLNTSDVAEITAGFSSRASVFPTSGSAFSLEDVSVGPQDLFATRATRSADGASALRFILRRGLELPDGAALPTLDFNSAEAFDAATPNVTLASSEASALAFGALYTKNGQFALPFFIDQPKTATRPYFALPENKLEAGDVQLLHVSAANQTAVAVDVYYRAPTDRTIRFGAPLIAPTLSVIGTASSPRIRARFVPQADYDQVTSISYQQASSTSLVFISMTPRYAAITGSYDVDVPDLVSVPGFDPAWALIPGHEVVWTAIRVGGTLPRGRNVFPADGMTRTSSTLQSTFVLP